MVVRDGVRLHYLDSCGTAAVPPVVFVPGMGDDADDYRDLLDELLPRRVLAVDLRGRGRSDAPESGWSLAHHVDDLDAVVGAAGLDQLHLASYSRGTAYALGWATTHPGRVLSVTIGDYGARQVLVPAEHREGFRFRRWRGRPMNERMDPRAIDAIFAAGEAVEFWDELGALGIPVLLLRGTEPGALVTDEVVARYRESVPGIEVVPVPGSGHDLWRPDPHVFPRTLASFLDRVDGADPARA